MTFSIIIPTYNRANIIGKTVESVLKQTFQDLEVIVVDDGSTDNTRTVLETITDDRLRYFYKKNEERSVARNFGAEQAKGSYLIFLDSDDRLGESHLTSLSEYLVKCSFKPKFLFTGYKVYSTDGKVLYQYKKKGIFNAVKLLYGNTLGCSPVVIERQLFLQHRFDTSPDLVVFEDWELWLRIISKEPLYCIPSGSVHMLNHGGRSVLNYGAAELEKKASCLRSLVMKHTPMVKNSSLAQRRFNMGVYSYVALHIALAKEGKLLSLTYLAKACRQDPGIIFRRRFYGIIKQLI